MAPTFRSAGPGGYREAYGLVDVLCSPNAHTRTTKVFHPVAERVLARCDGVLRIGGPSEGADRMVDVARRLGKAVYMSIEDIS